MATTRVLRFKRGAGNGPRVERSEPRQVKIWRSTHKAMHTQGGAYIKRSVATVGVLLIKGAAGVGPRVEESEPSWVRGGQVGGRKRGGRGGGVACREHIGVVHRGS